MNNEEKLNFYYNREARLAKASRRVRDLYEAQPKKRFAFFSSLTDTKPKAFMFTSIIVMSVLIFFVTYLVPDSVRGAALGKNNIDINVMRYNGMSFVVLKKTAAKSAKRYASKSGASKSGASKSGAYTGIVDLSIAQKDDAGAISIIDSRRVVFSETVSEEFRWSIENESVGAAGELIFYLQGGENQTSVRVQVE